MAAIFKTTNDLWNSEHRYSEKLRTMSKFLRTNTQFQQAKISHDFFVSAEKIIFSMLVVECYEHNGVYNDEGDHININNEQLKQCDTND